MLRLSTSANSCLHRLLKMSCQPCCVTLVQGITCCIFFRVLPSLPHICICNEAFRCRHVLIISSTCSNVSWPLEVLAVYSFHAHLVSFLHPYFTSRTAVGLPSSTRISMKDCQNRSESH
ncbi:hypothetical protein GDO78_002387 [Eleutherodactylus coqui]|uniref:Uncharacterized protein n=1 Tax=Eleutherodactylus coqui TaxID=57060 RepID=A0A8J6K322_ELECQ|nr:hypothetical protein GDO78_002387 [Eleutherodactylus coqui]